MVGVHFLDRPSLFFTLGLAHGADAALPLVHGAPLVLGELANGQSLFLGLPAQQVLVDPLLLGHVIILQKLLDLTLQGIRVVAVLPILVVE